MTFLPIVDRELRVRARHKMTHRFRLGSALVAMVLVVFMLFMASAGSSAQSVGQPMFHTLSWLAFVYCLFEGVRTTADCLSEEKRNGTLGLLFLTDLKGYDVVLGKFMASSLNSFYGLLAIFPPLAIPILIGGVTGSEFWRLTVIERKALGTTLAILFATAVVPCAWLVVPFPTLHWLASLSPAFGFYSLFDIPYSRSADPFTNSIWLLQLMSWSCLFLSMFLLPKVWQERVITENRGIIEAVAERFFPGTGGQSRHKRWLLNINPVLWLAASQERSTRLLWVLVSLTGVVGIASWLLVSTAFSNSLVGVLVLVALGVHLVIALCVVTQACHFFADARSTGALELLLCTPLPVPQIVEGHRLALKRIFGPPVATLIAIEFVIAFGHVVLAKSLGGGEGLMVLGAVAICLPVLVLDLYAAGEYGMWLGLTSKKATQAVTKTALYVIILPAFSIFCCWPVFAAVKNLILINYARDQLQRRFRIVATERFNEAEKESESLLPALPRRPAPRLPPVLPR